MPEEKKYLDADGLEQVLTLLAQEYYVEIPVVEEGGPFTYDGTSQGITFEPFNPDLVEILGTTTATDAGTYTCTANLKESIVHKWMDGTTAPKQFTWTIEKADSPLTLSSNSKSGTVVQSSTTVTVSTISTAGAGTVTASTTVGTVEISGSNINVTVAAVGTAYSGTVTISDLGDANHNPSSKTVTISNLKVVKIVTWADGTDAEIKALIQAADEGKCDLYQDAGWRVGDTRNMYFSNRTNSLANPQQISSKNHTVILMDRGISQKYVTVNTYKDRNMNDRNYPSFIVGLLNLETSPSKVDSTSGLTINWGNSGLRSQLSADGFYNALPTDIKSIAKQVKVPYNTATQDSGSTTTVNSYVAIPAAREIDGGNGDTTNDTASGTYNKSGFEKNVTKQLSYYATAANRIKVTYGTSKQEYWTRTIGRYCPTTSGGKTVYFCRIDMNGTRQEGGAYSNPANRLYYSPIFFI